MKDHEIDQLRPVIDDQIQENSSAIISGVPSPNDQFKIDDLKASTGFSQTFIENERDSAERTAEKNASLYNVSTLPESARQTRVFLTDKNNFNRFHDKAIMLAQLESERRKQQDLEQEAEVRALPQAPEPVLGDLGSALFEFASTGDTERFTSIFQDELLALDIGAYNSLAAFQGLLSEYALTAEGRAEAAQKAEGFGRMAQEAREELDRPKTTDDIESLKDFTGWLVGSGLEQATMLSGAAVSSATTGPVGTFAYFQNYMAGDTFNSIREETEKAGVETTALERIGIANTVGTVNGALDMILPAAVVKSFKGSKTAQSAIAKKATELWLQGSWKVGGSAIKGSMLEANTEYAQTIIEEVVPAIYDENREFFDAESREMAKEAGLTGGALGFVGGGAVDVQGAVKAFQNEKLENLRQNFRERAIVAAQKTVSAARAFSFANSLRSQRKTLSDMKAQSPNMDESSQRNALDKIGNPDAKVWVDAVEFAQLVGENPEIAEALQIQVDPQQIGPMEFNRHEILSALTDQQFEQITPILRMTPDSMTENEASAMPENEGANDAHWESLLEDSDTDTVEESQEKLRIRNDFQREVRRLQEQGAETRFADPELAGLIDAQARMIMSSHPNDPQAGIEALKRINIRDASVRAFGPDGQPDPVGFKKRVQEATKGFSRMVKAKAKESRAESKALEKERKAQDREVANALKEMRKASQAGKRALRGKTKESDQAVIANRSNNVDPNDTMIEALIKLRPHRDGLRSVGLEKVGGYQTDYTPIESVVEALFERGLLETNDTAEFVRKVNAEIAPVQEVDTTQEEEQITDLINRSVEVRSIGEAQAIMDEVQALPFIPEESLNEIESNINTQLESEVERLFAEAERADDELYDQSGEIKTESEAFKNWFGDSKVVDENGEPLVVYHGTNVEFEEFQENRATFFTDDKTHAEAYGPSSEYYVSIENPLVIEGGDNIEVEYGDYIEIEDVYTASNIYDFNSEKITRLAEINDNDGIVIKAKGETMVIAFSPTQIKSVNARSFDPTSPNIFEQRGGSLNDKGIVSWDVEQDVTGINEDGEEVFSDPYILISSVEVNREDRGKGYGKALVRQAISEIQSEKPGMTIRLFPDPFDVSEGKGLKRPELIEWYKSLGFEEDQDSEIGALVYDGPIIEKSDIFEQTEQQGFEQWSGGVSQEDVIEDWQINDHDFTTEGPHILKVYHGTTHDFNEFDATRGNFEGQFGAVNYFTSSEYDAEQNYAGEGPDLTQRIELRAEQIEAEEDVDPEVAKEQARQELSGGQDQTLELYVRTDKPFVIGDGNQWIELFDNEAIEEQAIQRVAEDNDITTEEVEENRDDYEDEISDMRWEIESGEETQLYTAIEEAAAEVEGLDAQSLYGEIQELGGEFTSDELESIMRNSETMYDVQDPETGELASSNVIANVIENLGYDSIILKNANERFETMDMTSETTHVHIFDADANKIKATESTFEKGLESRNIFEQQRKIRRGTYNSRTKLISLLEDANRSTQPHEWTHAWVDDVLALSQDPTANRADRELARENITTAGNWMNGAGRDQALRIKEQVKDQYPAQQNTDDEFIENLRFGGSNAHEQRVFHEMIAQGFETYLAEGKSPNKGMENVFQRFVEWMKEIYGEIQTAIAEGLLPPLDAPVRELFDSVINFDSDVVAIQKDAQLPLSALNSLGVTNKAEIDELRKLLGKSYQSMIKMKYDLLDEAMKKEKKNIEAIAKAEYEAQEFYRVVRNVENAGVIERESGRENLGDLFDVVAQANPEMFDTSGRDFVELESQLKLDSSEIAASAETYLTLDEITEQKLEEAREDILRRVDSAAVFSNPALLQYEQRLNDLIRGDRAPVSKAQMRRFAERKLAGLSLENVDPYRYASTANRLSVQRAKLTSKKEALTQEELAEVFSLGERIMLNMSMSQVGSKIIAEHNKINQQIFKRTAKQKQVKSTKRDTTEEGEKTILAKGGFRYEEKNYEAARLLADHFRIRRLTPKDKALSVEQVGSLETLQELVDPIFNTEDTEFLLSGKIEKDNYRQLTLEEIRALKLVIDNILHRGDREFTPTGLLDGEELLPSETLEAIIGERRPGKGRGIQTPSDASMLKIREFTRNVQASNESLMFQLRRYVGLGMNDNNTKGVDGIYGVLSEASNRALTMIDSKQDELLDILGYFEKRIDGMETTKNGVVIEPLLYSENKAKILQSEAEGNKWQAEQLLMLLMHMGTMENYSKLLDGYGFTEEQWNNYLDKRITTEDMDQIQRLWDLMGTMYEPANEVSKRITGVTISKKQVRSFEFKGKEYKGGYAPATQDFSLTGLRQDRLDETPTFKNGTYVSAFQTSMNPSALQKITGVKLPLAGRFSMVSKHVEQMAKFIHLQPALYYADVIIKDDAFVESYRETMGKESFEALKNHIERLAQASPDRSNEDVDTLAKKVQNRIRRVAFINNIMVRLIQPTALIPIVQIVPNGKDWIEGLKHWSTVDQLSDYMRLRPETAYSDIERRVTQMKPSETRRLTGDLFSKIAGKEVKGSTLEDIQQHAVYAGIAGSDNIAARWAWSAKYAQELRNDPTNRERAIRRADEMIQRKWDSGRDIDKILSMQRGGLHTMFTLFGSYTLRVLYQNNVDAWINLKGGRDAFGKRAMDFMIFQVTNNWGPMLIAEAVRSFVVDGEDVDDDEEWAKIGAMTIASSFTGPLPYIGNALLNPKYAPFSQFEFGWRNIQNFINGTWKGDIGKMGWSAAGFFNDFVTFPVITAWKRGKKYYDRLTGEEAD